jgi:AcrR family transcriptional regulator
MALSAKRRSQTRDELTTRRRDEVLRAAAHIFAQHGYQGTDVQEIADACGIAKGTIYLYFTGKEELFLATVDRAMVCLKESVKSAYEGIEDSLDRIAIAVRAYFQHFRDCPEHAELLIIERAVYRDRKTPTYLEHRKTATCEWEEVYAGLIRSRRIRNIPVDRISRVLSDLVYGTMFTDHFSERKRTPTQQAEAVLDIFFNGILTAAERRKRRGRLVPG